MVSDSSESEQRKILQKNSMGFWYQIHLTQNKEKVAGYCEHVGRVAQSV